MMGTPTTPNELFIPSMVKNKTQILTGDPLHTFYPSEIDPKNVNGEYF